MWRKRRWWIIAAVAAVAIMAFGTIGAISYAQSNNDDAKVADHPLFARVAEILEIPQSDLEDAFKQAGKELADEAIGKKLDALVESGKLTREEANNYLEWWTSRPDTLPGFEGIKGFGPGVNVPKGFGPGIPGGPGGHMGPRGNFKCFPAFGQKPPVETPEASQ